MSSRRDFYEQRAPQRVREAGRHYHTLLNRHFAFLIPPGQRVLEIGCGLGDTLAAVKPARGVGVDFSPAMVELAKARHPQLEFRVAAALDFTSAEPFDYIILSDLVNDLPDVQAVLERVRALAHPKTRLVLNFFNNLWKPALAMAESLGEKAPTLQQNWLSAGDLRNLLHLAGWELVKQDTRITWPVNTPLVERLFNRWLGPLLPDLSLAVFMVARLRPSVPPDRHFTCSVVIPARNESGNIEAAVLRTPELGKGTEIIFIEGHSKDNTWEEIQRIAAKYPQRNIKLLKQQGKGKGSACREAFAAATGDILFILDADLSRTPEEMP